MTQLRRLTISTAANSNPQNIAIGVPVDDGVFCLAIIFDRPTSIRNALRIHVDIEFKLVPDLVRSYSSWQY